MVQRRSSYGAAIAAVLCSIVLSGCAQEATLEPGGEAATSVISNTPLGVTIVPMCQVGCLDSDPNPAEPGVFLGSGVTDDLCGGDEQTDHDGDGLSTFCENNLAVAFAPELRYAWGDEVGREPYWAAKPLAYGNASKVTIAYLLSYYIDTGSSAWGCVIPPGSYFCPGHNGDSEAIVLEVYYDANTKHWVLSKAVYSTHETYGVFSKGNKQYPMALQYPSHPGAYPRSYVAVGKHANYNSVSACNNGAFAATDDCSHVDTSERVFVSGAYNVGSSDVHLIDCVESRDPGYVYYGSGRQECYWSSGEFRGWIPTWVGGTTAMPGYGARLSYFGY